MDHSRAANPPLTERLRRRIRNIPTPPGLLFFREFLAHPRLIGSVVPTARATVDALLRWVDWDNAKVIVEYGPGTGVFTRRILDNMGPDAHLIAIDPHPGFIRLLSRTIRDPRLILVKGSAEDVEAIVNDAGHGPAQHIISGLPFSTLPEGVGDAIVAATARALAPGGDFLVYQYSLYAKPMLDTHFERVELARAWRCVPPARLMRAITPPALQD